MYKKLYVDILLLYGLCTLSSNYVYFNKIIYCLLFFCFLFIEIYFAMEIVSSLCIRPIINKTINV